jgi:hypothetical protein
MADAPFMPLAMERTGVARVKSEGVSALAEFHCPFDGRVLRGAGFAQSPALDTEFAAAEAFEDTVAVDELEADDETDEEELDRCMVFRDANMFIPSELVEFRPWPPSIHPVRLRFPKLGGAATAVIWKGEPLTRGSWRWEAAGGTGIKM